MQQRQLGKLSVSAIGLGCMGMSEFYGASNEADNIKLLHEAYDSGINFFDTADMYGQGNNERLLGEALKNLRDDIIIATKFGLLRSDDPQYRGICGSPDYVKKSCDGSLQRLNMDYIDLYYQHRVDPNTPIEETVGAMAELVHAGKVKYLGLSEVSLEELKRAHAVHPITAVQTEYSLLTRVAEDNGVIDFCRENNIGFVAYSPLSRALLSHNLQNEALAADDFRKHLPRFSEESLTENQKLLQALSAIAEKQECTLPQLALAWLLAQGDNIVPIPGTRRSRYLQENIAATKLNLSNEIVSEVNTLISQHTVAGARYSAAAMKTYNMES